MHNVFAAIMLFGASVLCGQTGKSYLVTVSDVRTSPSADNGAPGMKQDLYIVKFKGTVRNATDHVLLISVDPIISVKNDILLPSGEWKTMSTYSFFDTGDTKYLQCTKVEPGKAFAFPNVSDMVVLGRDRPANSKAAVRLHFYNVCMAGSATHSTSFVTEPIEINN